MIRHQYLPLCTALLLSANVYGFTPEQSQTYEKAKSLYSQQAYGEAYTLLSGLYQDNLDNAELNYILGKSAFESNEYSMALAAFERVSFLEPDNIRNRLELARAQYQIRLFEEAEIGFNEILKVPAIPENVRKNIEYYLAAIAQHQQRSFLHLTARAGILYDSNVNFGSSSDTVTLPTLGTTFNTDDPVDDFAHEESLNLDHLYDIGLQGGAMIRNSLAFYNRQYFEEEGYDFRLLSYSPAFIYNEQKSSYELIASLDRSFLEQHSYYTGFSLNPKWTYVYSPSLRHILSFKAGEKNYFQSSDGGLDSNQLELSGGLETYLSTTNALRGDFTLTRQSSKGGNREDVDYDEYGLNILYTDQLHSKQILQVNLGAKKRLYDDFNIASSAYRSDETMYGTFNFIQRLNDALSVELLANYTHTDSTLAMYSYDKCTLSISLSGRF